MTEHSAENDAAYVDKAATGWPDLTGVPDPAENDAVGYRRDASWWNAPNTSDPKRIHLDDGHGFAVCNTRTLMLTEDQPVHLASLPHDDHLCRRCFPAAGLGLPLASVIPPVMGQP